MANHIIIAGRSYDIDEFQLHEGKGRLWVLDLSLANSARSGIVQPEGLAISWDSGLVGFHHSNRPAQRIDFVVQK